ncbi:hydroxyacid oxidase 1 [Caerostris darwini]|uniref:Hydroxyacid oxidase 1 n=1 Tax=Caerostris darwini TaxID=1538125 RepID=A0AAV4QJV4_9ARAC|nr:hydroxyacid oxidase 1 [Caerostris darwini]
MPQGSIPGGAEDICIGLESPLRRMMRDVVVCLIVSCTIAQYVVGYIPRDSMLQRKLWSFRRLDTPYMSTLRDYEEYAVAYMDRHARDYYGSGAEDELTLRDNEKAFQKYRLRPRLLRNVAVRNMSLTMLGQPVGMPLGISPIAFQKMAHPDGEIATARGEAFALLT